MQLNASLNSRTTLHSKKTRPSKHSVLILSSEWWYGLEEYFGVWPQLLLETTFLKVDIE